MEAIYNLGLVNMHLGLPGDSLQAFEKLHTIIPNNTEVIYHIANLYEVKRTCAGKGSGPGLGYFSRRNGRVLYLYICLTRRDDSAQV